jgi:hypothetical protein
LLEDREKIGLVHGISIEGRLGRDHGKAGSGSELGRKRGDGVLINILLLQRPRAMGKIWGDDTPLGFTNSD